MKQKIALLIVVTGFSVTGAARGEDQLYSIRIDSGVSLPVGSQTDFLTPGVSLSLAGELAAANSEMIGYDAFINYSANGYGDDALASTISAGAGLRVVNSRESRMRVFGELSGGYAVSLYPIADSWRWSGSPIISISGGVGFRLTNNYALHIRGGYSFLPNLYGNMLVSFGGSYDLGEGKPIEARSPFKLSDLRSERITEPPADIKTAALEVKDLVLEPLLPVFYSFYLTHPIGSLTLVNSSAQDITDIDVAIYVSEFMIVPMKTAAIDLLRPGVETKVSIKALFTDDVLEETEGTTVAAEIAVNFTIDGERREETLVDGLRVEFRNAVTWDDDRRAAAFITARDPWIQTFAKSVLGAVQNQEYKIPENLSAAIGLYEALRLYGMFYVVDPNSPYKEMSDKEDQIDSIQFPRETLGYRAGDCDDLSILFCALLESVGVETAFITVPGHILPAFNTGLSSLEGGRQFLDTREIIFHDDFAWIPVEMTALDESFFEVWAHGAKQWREHSVKEQARFYPVSKAWEEYQPVALPEKPAVLDVPGRDQILKAHRSEVEKYVEAQIYSSVVALRERIRESNSNQKWVNQLGVVYARYGLYEKALEEFEAILAEEVYLPALLNTGMIHLIRKEYSVARSFFNRAFAAAPEDPQVLLSIARVNHELENYGMVQESYSKLKALDPKLAEEYAYLAMRGEAAVRAGEISGIRSRSRWIEDDGEGQ
ncbi:MAG: hypothetical protein HN368_12640 [Spirochaetales bacterium]|nr:hypothetical protein [Spirochaetales bacterium]